jgi:membrane protein
MPRWLSDILTRPYVHFAIEAGEAFLADDVSRLAAAMAYFLLLATAPIVLLANILLGALGLLAGQQAAPGALNGSAASTASSYYQQVTAWAGSWSPWIILVLVLVGAMSVFGQFVQSVDIIWKTPKRTDAVRGYLRQRTIALALLGVAAGAVFVALIVASIIIIVVAIGITYAQNIGIPIPEFGRSLLARAAMIYVASSLLFAVAFVLAPDRKVRWLDALPAALVTGAAFLVGEQVLALYLTTTQRFAVFGSAQFFVGLTVWLYYSALVALGGVELSRVMVLDAEARREDAGPPASEQPADQPAGR